MHCLMRPSDKWASRLRVLLPRGQNIAIMRVLSAVDAMDRLGIVLGDSMEAHRTSDGRLDLRDVAFDVLVEIVRSQRKLGQARPLQAIPVTDGMVDKVAEAIERALERSNKQGMVDMKDAAVALYADITARPAP